MPLTIYGALRSNSSLDSATVTYGITGTVFQISAYSQITLTDGTDPSIIAGDSVTNETSNDSTQTVGGDMAFWDYTVNITDGTNNYQIGYIDRDLNNNGTIGLETTEQGWFIGFLGDVPPLNTNLTVTEITDNSAFIPVDDFVPCFVSGTLVQGISGQIPVEKLKVGDQILTADRSYQKIRWIGKRRLDAVDLAQSPKLLPVCITKGALGCGLPKRDLRVSPQHRMVIRSKIARRMYETDEILIPAIKLVDLTGISQIQDIKEVEYIHLLLDNHEVIFAEGAPTESLLTGPQAMKSFNALARAEIAQIFPDLEAENFKPVAARHIPITGKSIKRLIRRHIKNDRPLLN